jgi:hypothetical protein
MDEWAINYPEASRRILVNSRVQPGRSKKLMSNEIGKGRGRNSRGRSSRKRGKGGGKGSIKYSNREEV